MDVSCSYITVLRLITVGTNANDTQELDERIRNCISYLTEEFFRDFYLTMRRHRVTASNVKELFYMCCIHFFKRYNLSMCIILGLVTGQFNFLVYEGYKIVPMYCIVYENQYKTCLYCK